MPSIDIFSDLRFDDKIGLALFLQAHDSRHKMYQQIATLQSLQFPNYDFSEYPDSAWFADHYAAHIALARLSIPNPSTDITVLTDFDWSEEPMFYTWMQTHQSVHQQLDQALGLI